MKSLSISLQVGSSLVLAVTAIIVRFQNPYLTETQLFLYLVQDYWWAFAQIVVTQIVVAILARKRRINQ